MSDLKEKFQNNQNSCSSDMFSQRQEFFFPSNRQILVEMLVKVLNLKKKNLLQYVLNFFSNFVFFKLIQRRSQISTSKSLCKILSQFTEKNNHKMKNFSAFKCRRLLKGTFFFKCLEGMLF